MAIYKLGDIGEIKGGISTLNKNKYDSGIGFVNYMDVFKNYYINDETKLRKYNSDENEWNKYNLIYGDALFTASSEDPKEIAFSTIYLSNKKAIFNGFCKRFRFNTKILNPKYASFLFRSNEFRNNVKKYATGYTRYNISQKDLLKLKIIIPEIKEQQEIIDIIEQNEQLFLSHSSCVRIDSVKNVKKDMKKIIDIIEPVEKSLILLKNISRKIIELIKKQSVQIKEKMYLNCSFNKGKTFSSKDFQDYGIPFLDIKSLTGKISKYLPINKYEKNTIIGDVLLSLDGTPGRLSILNEGFNGYAYNVKSDIHNKGIIWASLLNNMNQKIIKINSIGTTIKHSTNSKKQLYVLQFKDEKNIELLYNFFLTVNKLVSKFKILKLKYINLLII